MPLATFDGGRIGKVVADRVIDLTDLVGAVEPESRSTRSAMRTLIQRWDRLSVQVAERRTGGVPLADVQFEAPIGDPSKLLAAPINYRDHQSEMNVEADVGALGLFLKAPSSILDPGGTIQLPYHDRRFDQEGELAVVIGRLAHRISESDARSHIFGYTGLLDITMRGGEDRSTRKSFTTFSPIGPWIATADEFGDPRRARLRCWVNDELRQEADTRDLIWDVDKLVSYASWISPLEPGDIITTGTPAGVGPLSHGDTIRLDISGLGDLLTATVTSEGAVASHTRGNTGAYAASLPRAR